MNNIDKIIEELAELEHKRWSSWQRYCHDMILKNGGKITSPYPFEQWERQIKTPYSELSEKEKESDRKEARNTLKIIKKYITQIRQETIRECIDSIKEFNYNLEDLTTDDLVENLNKLKDEN